MLSKNIKVLVVSGPTAVGKTSFALEIARQLSAELISADSRQVYRGNDLETGKDLDLIAKSKIKVWLIDILNPGEEFSVSNWKDQANKIIEDISSRGKLPIVVGGTGLYIRALLENLSEVDIPRDEVLRKDLANKTASELFDYLNNLNPTKANSLNNSDKHNPRRLIRAIEIAKTPPSLYKREGTGVSYLHLGLIAPKEFLEQRIADRVVQRGLSKDYIRKEINIMHQQITWFNKYKPEYQFDISTKNGLIEAKKLVLEWYNNSYAKKD